MASATVNVDDLSCPICMEIFDTAKSLPCGHSFCEDCVTELIENKIDSATITCPECRTVCPVPSTGLANNYGLNRLVEQFSKQSQVTVIKSDMHAPMEATAKRTTWRVINNSPEADANVLTDSITAIFERKYGGFWQCIIGGDSNEVFGFTIHKKPRCYISMKIKERRIYLYKSDTQKPCWKCGNFKCNGAHCPRRVTVKGTTLPPEVQEQAKTICLSVLAEKKTATEIARGVTEEFERLYKSKWSCIVISESLENGFSCARKQGDCFIKIIIDNVMLTVFKN